MSYTPPSLFKPPSGGGRGFLPSTSTTPSGSSVIEGITNVIGGGGRSARGGLSGGYLGGGGNVDTIQPDAGYGADLGAIYDLLGGGTLESNRNAQQNNLLAGHLLGQQGRALDRQGLQSDARYALGNNALDRQLLGIQAGAANRDIQSVNQLLGINERSYNRTVASVANLLGLNEEELANSLAGIALSEDINRRGLRDDAVARGAFNAPGTRQGFTDIEKEAELQRVSAEIGAARTEQGLHDRQGNALDTRDITKINLNDRAAGNQDILRRIQIEGQRLNLNADQINSSLEQGLARLGLADLTSVNDLVSRLLGGDLEQATMAANLLGQAAQLAGLPIFSGIGQPGGMAGRDDSRRPVGGRPGGNQAYG